MHGSLELVQLFVDGAGVAVQEPERNSKSNIFSFPYMLNPLLCYVFIHFPTSTPQGCTPCPSPRGAPGGAGRSPPETLFIKSFEFPANLTFNSLTSRVRCDSRQRTKASRRRTCEKKEISYAQLNAREKNTLKRKCNTRRRA